MDQGQVRDWLRTFKFLEKSLLIFSTVVLVGISIISGFEDFGSRLILALGVLLLVISGLIVTLEKSVNDMGNRILISMLVSVVCMVFLYLRHSFQPHEYLLSGILFASVFSAVLTRWHNMLRFSAAIVAWGYAYTNITTEVISHSNHRPEIILELGDTISMGPYFASFIENIEGEIKVEYFDVVPRLYKRGSLVKVDDMTFMSKTDHYTSIEFFNDLEKNWSIVPLMDHENNLEAWSNGTAGEKVFQFINVDHKPRKRRTLAFSVKNEILGESSDGKMIIVRATKLPFTIVILLGGLMFLINLFIRIVKTLLKNEHESYQPT
jgi:hypothetical protein